ncbi:phage minor head protein [Ideonella sp.]|uniref:phage head morphogenesis protein n=1 Tax=Ideonella sp. TaxID=1929293 RepID=UPI003BB753B7
MLIEVIRGRAPREWLRKGRFTPIDPDRPEARKAHMRLKKDLIGWLKGKAEGVADQLARLLDLVEKAKRKPGGDPVALATAAQRAADVLAQLDFDDWTDLIVLAHPRLQAMAQEGAAAALAQLGIDPSNEVTALLEGKTTEWASQRAAELVGRRRLDDGTLVENPNATWRIDASTREKLRGLTEEALAEGWSADELKAAVKDSGAFSSARAETIARTEIAHADMAGAMAGYRASGVVRGKVWSTAADDRVSEECQACADAGEISLDDLFPGGVDAPPLHPRCRCTVLPVLEGEQAEQTGSKSPTKEAQHGQ